MSRHVIFDELFRLHSKSEEYSGKAKDVIKQVEFESPTIRNFCEEKQFEAPDETDQDLQIQPQHQNLAQVEEFE